MITETIKAHPFASVAVLGVGCIVLYAAIGGGSAPAAAVAPGENPGLQAAELQAATAAANGQLAYKASKDRTDADLAIANLAANVQLNSKYSDNTTALEIAKGTFGIQSKGIDANVILGSKSLDAQTSQELARLKQVTDVAGITSAVNMAGISANRDTSIYATSALARAQETTARLGAETSQALSRDAANMNASNQKSKTAGGILGAVSSFLPLLAFL